MRDDSSKWYSNFWPWFIIGLMGTAITASLITVYIAIEGSDDIVSDTYYKDGLAINQVLEQDELAMTLELKAQLYLSTDKVIANVMSVAPLPDQIILKLIHPADDMLDQTIFLFHEGNGQYQGAGKKATQRYYLQLIGSHEGQMWRLNGEFHPGIDVVAM